MRTRITSLGLWIALAGMLCVSPCLASDARETPLVRAVKRAQRSVVNIHSEKTSYDKDGVFAGGPGRKVNGMGTGIIIDERGYIVTNQHVIADVDTLRTTMFDGSTYTARVISYDRKRDLAVIKVDPTRPLHVIPLGTSSDLMLGETVIAVGNAFGYEHTVTAGILSSLSRDVEVNEHQSYENLLQTDASINPGNSGGPLLNLDGEVVGINVAIRAGAQRIGFAIPIDDARRHVARLLNTGRLNDTYHGLVTHDVKKAHDLKLIVDSAEPNSPAAVAGFRAGDVVVQAGPVPVSDQADLERAFLGHSPGESVDVVVSRDSEQVTLKVQLAKVSGGGTGPLARKVSRPVSQTVVQTDNSGSPEELVWDVLGLRISKALPAHLGQFSSNYRGGLRVDTVRTGSPAFRAGIKPGDILVGIHEWETIKIEDLHYVLTHPKRSTFEPLKFYMVRGPRVHYGHLQLSDEAK